MDRRAFLVRSARAGAVLLLVPTGLAGCDGGEPEPDSAPTGAPALLFTSDEVKGHVHAFPMSLASLGSPPAGRVEGPTTSTLGHLHTIALSEAEAYQLTCGGTVAKETSMASGHAHVFTFSLANGALADGDGSRGDS